MPGYCVGVTGKGRRARGLGRRPSIAEFIPRHGREGSTIHERLRGYTHGFHR